MAKLTKEQIAEITNHLEKQYQHQKDINSSLDGYLKGLEKLTAFKKNIETIEKNLLELKAKQGKGTDLENEKTTNSIFLLEKKKKALEDEFEIIRQTVKETKKLNMVAGTVGLKIVKAGANLHKLPGFITGKLGLLRGIFEMDKAIRTTVTQMGALGKQGDIVRTNIKAAAMNTTIFGAGVKEIAEIQAQYTETLGRNVVLNQKSLETIAQMGKATGLGLEGATEMATQFDRMGISAEMTGKFVQQTLDNSSAMGLNATKVVKNLNQNFKMLNRYRFKDGIKGITKMAELATKLGVSMDFVAGMADKLWNVEGAVEMSAQLQVMGGAFAQMADPFKLMYMARNDTKALTENIANAAAASMHFAKDGSIQLAADEMHRLKIIAEQTGLEYNELVEAGKTAFKLSKIKLQVGGLTPEVQEFVANTSEFKDGKAYIKIEGEQKLVSRLNKAEKDKLLSMVKEKKTMEDRAKEAVSFDEKITNLINMVKTSMIPIVEALTEGLEPLVKKFTDKKFIDKLVKLGEDIGKFVETMAKTASSIIGPIVDYLGPNGLLATAVLFNVAKWVINGLSLAKGFMIGTGGLGGKGGMFGKSGGKGGVNMKRHPAGTVIDGKKVGGQMGMNFKGAAGSAGAIGGGLLAGGYYAYDEYNEQLEKGKTKGEAAGRAALKGAGAGLGAWGGAAAGAAIGSVVPVVGTIIGGLIGGALGAWGGGALTDLDNYEKAPKTKDGMFGGMSPKNLTYLPKALASTSRGIIQGGKITPIDNKDDVLAMKPGGMIDQVINNKEAKTMKIEFGDINISGEIKVNLPGTTQIGIELAKNPEFKTAIARAVNSQVEKNINGGKNRG
jgi:hypothetical protein